MLWQTFCYWGKQQSADRNVIQFHFTLKCTKDQSSHFCDCFLVSKWLFQHHDRGLTTFHAGSKQLLSCVVSSSCPAVKHKNTAHHVSGKYWMQARGFLNYRLILLAQRFLGYCICQPKKLNGKFRKKLKSQTGGQAKIWGGHGPPRPPLRIATAATRHFLCFCKIPQVVWRQLCRSLYAWLHMTTNGANINHVCFFLLLSVCLKWQRTAWTLPYINRKKRLCRSFGITVRIYRFQDASSTCSSGCCRSNTHE